MKIYTWVELNNLLRKLHSEAAALELFNQQKAAGASARWLNRIWSRYVVLRNKRERREVAQYRGPRMPKKEKENGKTIEA